MTRDELIAAIRAKRMPMGSAEARDFNEGLGAAEELVEQLDSPPAMAWQGEPSEDMAGDYVFVEGVGNPVLLEWSRRPHEEWQWLVHEHSRGWQPLNGRRVCPIPAPPAPADAR